MSKLLRKFWVVILIITLMIPVLPDIRAAGLDGARVVFDPDGGSFVILTAATKAKTSIRYKTIGWMVHAQERCASGKSQCAPNYPEVGIVNDNSIDYACKNPDSSHPSVPTKYKNYCGAGDDDLLNVFTITKAEVVRVFADADILGTIDGAKFYMSAIFKTYDASTGATREGPIYSLSGIKNAEGWGAATMNDFPQYYDVEVSWQSGIYQVDVIMKTEAGTTLRTDKTSQCPSGCKSGATASYKFPESITKDGKTYRISRSYIVQKAKSSVKLYEQKIGDASLLSRNIKVSVGGNNIIAEYFEGPPPPSYPDKPAPPGETRTVEDMKPNPEAEIRADDRNNEKFRVEDGIPTSEDLYANVKTKGYLYRYTFEKISDKKTYEISVTRNYNRTWTEQVACETGTCEEKKEDTVPITQVVKIDRFYSYWMVPQFEAYGVEKAVLEQYALPGGNKTLYPRGYTPPLSDSEHKPSEEDHIKEPVFSESLDAGEKTLSGGSTPPSIPNENTEFIKLAEAAIPQILVKNDKLNFNGVLVMNNAETPKDGPAPGTIPESQPIGENVLYEKDLMIEPTKPNKKDAPSTGMIHYKLLEKNVNPSASGYEEEIPNINNVTVHTPVVNYSDTSDEPQFNQKTVPNAARKSFILDRPFYIDMPTNGMHRSILGYGNRDYAKYTKQKQVQFEFDVWVGADKRKYVEAGNWIEVPVNQERMWFFLPVWVEEGDYTVYFRQIAINSPISGFGWQQDANTQLENYYVATDTVDVEVIGRLYDFHITDIADYNWQSVFRQSDGVTPTGQSYWVGGQDIDGDVRGNPNPYHLSILSGSHPNAGKKNISVKTGYHFKFDMKTKGNMFGDGDGIQITPTFEFVYKNGTGRQPVDLYYIRSQDRKYIKIGSQEDQEKRYTILGEPLRNVPRQEMLDTAPFYTEGYNAYYQQSLRKTEIGWWDYLLLTRHLRTFIGPKTNIPDSVDPDRALVAEQKWYGEYALPAAPYVVPANTNIAEWGRLNGGLDNKSKLWLRDGYIIVNFKIETVRNRDVTHPHLQYMRAPNVTTWDNQWRLEGFQHSVTDPYGNVFRLYDGDVMFYHADKSSRDDFDSNQTH